MLALDKERYVAHWSESAAAAARRRLPSAPNKDESATDESLREVEKILARSEVTSSNIRPSYKPSLKPLIDNTGATSYRLNNNLMNCE